MSIHSNGKIAYDPAKGYLQASLPTPYPSNHAAALTELPDGDLLCAYFAGTKEGHPDIHIVMARMDRRTGRWSDPVKMSDDPGRSEQNPVFFPDPDGRLWLLYTAQNRYQYSAEVRCRVSDDAGGTWSGVRRLFDKPGSFIREPAVVLKDGDWLIPAYYSLPPRQKGGAAYGNDYSVVKISSDKGLTWREYPVPRSRGYVHMDVVYKKDGGYRAFFRSRWADYIYRSDSPDGRHWEEPRPTRLPSNNSSLQLANLQSGRLALVCNPVHCSRYVRDDSDPYFQWVHPADRGGRVHYDMDYEKRDAVWQPPRAPLTIFLSEDDGETWPWHRDIEGFPEGYDIYKDPQGNANPEGVVRYTFAYPAICQGRDGRIHVAYSHGRDYIRYVQLDEEWIISGRKVSPKE